MMRSTIINSAYTIIFFLVTVPVFAQGPPPATPIDGGLSLLLAAGGVYGVKKIRDARKDK